MRKFGKLLLVVWMALGGVALSQSPAPPPSQHTVTGTVTSNEDGLPLPGVNVMIKGKNVGVATQMDGTYRILVRAEDVLTFAYIGFVKQEIRVGQRTVIDVVMEADIQALDEVVVTESSQPLREAAGWVGDRLFGSSSGAVQRSAPTPSPSYRYVSDSYAAPEPSREGYAEIEEKGFQRPTDEPLSTFSIDVDRASYSNVRRFINQGQRPPANAVRIEEMVNYFGYDYAQPKDRHPFAIHTELAPAPWAPQHYVMQVGLQGKVIPTEDLPATNLVFLLDVSGSMNSPNKLGLVKSSMRMLTQQMRPEDRVAIVVYAGAAGVVLPSTDGNHKQQILDALDQLTAGGSTAGGAGIELAYRIAQENFMQEGNNRVILCTDGDFNVGVSSEDGLEKLIEKKRDQGVFLTVLGYGMGNYQDGKMEVLADKGNGNYAYIDNLQEARKTLVNEFGGTLFTIAKDVKIQIEFNPQYVAAYRLIGYENRMLAAEDFNNDRKDAGELGSGHTVTALYEIIPVGVNSPELGRVDPLKYQNTTETVTAGIANGELATVKFRYKAPQGLVSQLITQTVGDEPTRRPSANFQWATSVAEFGMLLRDSEYKGQSDFNSLIERARAARGIDEEGYRSEFIRLVESSQALMDFE